MARKMHDPKPQALGRVGSIKVEIYDDRELMGLAAAINVAAMLKRQLLSCSLVSLVFASAPSQNEFLEALSEIPDLDWSRIIAFHMDEYIGLSSEAPQSFGRFLRDKLFHKVKPGQIHYLNGNGSEIDKEIDRYTTLLTTYPPSVVCGGIGENGHLAFNDPQNADFDDPDTIKVVELALRSRQQQVHDGCFAQLEDVPRYALTLTIPALFRASGFSCVVPGKSKAKAVKKMLTEPISPACPASILRRHPQSVLFLEPASAALIQTMDIWESK